MRLRYNVKTNVRRISMPSFIVHNPGSSSKNLISVIISFYSQWVFLEIKPPKNIYHGLILTQKNAWNIYSQELIFILTHLNVTGKQYSDEINTFSFSAHVQDQILYVLYTSPGIPLYNKPHVYLHVYVYNRWRQQIQHYDIHDQVWGLCNIIDLQKYT